MHLGALPHVRPFGAPHRHGRVAFLSCGVAVRLLAKKPSLEVIQSNSLAHMLRRRRHELGLFRKDAAKILGVCDETLMGWERNRTPTCNWFPNIISFLGYEPWNKPVLLSELLKAERLRRGLSIRGAAAILEIDHCTYNKWERGIWKPKEKMMDRIQSFLKSA